LKRIVFASQVRWRSSKVVVAMELGQTVLRRMWKRVPCCVLIEGNLLKPLDRIKEPLNSWNW
jgi:hypothetical protein